MFSRRSTPSRTGDARQRSKSRGTQVAGCDDVTIEEYLAHRPAISHLFDLAPQLDPAGTGWDPEGSQLDASRLVAVARRNSRHTDIRLLVDDGERYLAAAIHLAESMWCDVYITPRGGGLRFLREYHPVTGESWDVALEDMTTSEPVEWLVVRPGDMPAETPTWFVTARGRLRPRSGLVSVPLPGGLAFATKATFRDTAHLSARMRAGTTRVTTVAVNADQGRFEISRFEDSGSLLGGVEFATLVAASLDVVHPDVQLALTWPTDAEACNALDAELMRVADALNRTVWVPKPAGGAHVLLGCGELAAVDEVGSPAEWLAYPSRLDTGWEPHHGTDADGRLVPAGEVAVVSFPGVPLVSVPATQLEGLGTWYESVAPSDSLFAIDLALLADGRLGVCREDGIPLAIGPRHLRTLLRDAGWSGQELLLLTQPPAQYWDAALEHAGQLVDDLKVDIWLPALGAEVSVRPDGTLAAEGPDGTELAWHGLLYAVPDELSGPDAAASALPAALARPPGQPAVPALPPQVAHMPQVATTPHVAPAARMALESEAVELEFEAPAEVLALAAGAVASAALAAAATEEPELASSAPAAQPAVEPVGVVLPRVAKLGGTHAVPWLPTSPVVNARPVELYLWTSLAQDHIENWGLPSPDLFLLACQDPLRLADRQPTGYLLRVSVPAQAAIDLLEHSQHMPAKVQQRLSETGHTHMLPLAWLSGVTVTARFNLDGVGGIVPGSDVDHGALAICFEGAEHGVTGLPNEVVNWPGRRQRDDAPSYLMLPGGPDFAEPRPRVPSGYIALHRRRPKIEDGYRLLEVRLRQRCVIDVPATLDKLNGLPIVGRLHDFVGLDLLLSEQQLGSAYVTKAWRSSDGKRPIVDKLDGEPLATALAFPVPSR